MQTNTYPSNPPSTPYIPILDGVAARLRLSNASNGGFECSVAQGALVTKNMSSRPAPIEATAMGGWAAQCTDIVEDNSSGTRRLLATYSGAAIPALDTNAYPDGWDIAVHVWGIEDNGVHSGFYPAGVSPYGGGSAFSVNFVPYFKIQAASTTTTLADGSDQYWYLYLAKPLNYNQRGKLNATATCTGITGNLTVSYDTNGYGQVTAVKVLLPLGSQHPSTPNNTLHLQITESLRYLKGDAFVTETITHVNTDYPVTIINSVDTTQPVITEARILPVASMDASYQSEARQFNAQDQYTGHKSAISGNMSIRVKGYDAGSGLQKIECWWEGGNSRLFWSFDRDEDPADWDLRWKQGGVGNIMTSSLWGHTDISLGANEGRFLIKFYDKQGNTASRYVDPPHSGNPQSVYLCTPTVWGNIYPQGGTLNTSTNQWSAITSVGVGCSGGPAFVSKVEFYLDNVLAATVPGSSTEANPGNYNEIACSYRGVFNVPAGSHTIKVIVYDTLNPAHTQEQSWPVSVTAYSGGGGGGGGCVDYQAQILMADMTTRPAIEVQVEDLVLTRNPITGAFSIKPVGEVLLMGTQPCYRIVGEDGVEGIVSATHRIYVPNRNAYFETKDLRMGMDLLRPDGEAVLLRSVEPLGDRPVLTYSIHDGENKNYFADGTLAHNMKTTDCVLPGTLITMADGTQKPIETVEPGEQVLAWNTKTKQFEPDTVLTHFVTRNGRLYRVTLEDGHTVTCTGTHVLYAGGIWLSVNDIVKFKSTAKVMVEDGSLSAIASVEPLDVDPETEVRLIEVKNNHNLLLGGMLCHNIVKQQTMSLYVDGVYMGEIAV